jgi:YidC/Oxa1 family membrane protein insertase
MFALLQTIFREVVFRPELNILYFFYQYTNDIGVSIVILAFLVNICMLPLYAKSYVNGQKSRLLQPQIQALREKYKDNPQEFIKQYKAFNLKHNVSNASTFYTLLAQLFFASGLYYLTNDIARNSVINGLYPQIFNTNSAAFDLTAFDFFHISDSASTFIWLPLSTAFLTHILGRYTTDWAPKLTPIKKKEERKDGEKEPMFDPEAFAQSMSFQSKYVLPFFLFLINYNFSIGVNIYFFTSTSFSLIRQVIISQYYANHLAELSQEIARTDPEVSFDPQENKLIEDGDELDAANERLLEQHTTVVPAVNDVQFVTKNSNKKTKAPAKKVAAKPTKTPKHKKSTTKKTVATKKK